MVDDMNLRQTAQPDDTGPPPGQPDDTEPPAERQTELIAAYTANTAAHRPPYGGVRIRNRNELFWIMRRHDWSGNRLAEGKKRADLRRSILRRVDLSGAYLYEADLSYARLEGTNLSNAHLGGAHLTGADLVGANLSHADLAYAKLNGARLYRADLSNAGFGAAILTDANLSETSLSGTDLRQADLRGANLKEARMDAWTKLADITLNSKTYLGDVVWNEASVVRVNWTQMPRLGDENSITSAGTREERIKAYRNAARAYRGLATVLREQGLLIPASEYHLREQRLERRALLTERKVLSWLFSMLLEVLAGYGERPRRPFLAYLVVVLGFAALYYFLAQSLHLHQVHLSIWGAFVYSVTSFHGRGFFPGPGITDLDNSLIRFAAAEAVIGLFIEITFIAAFTRRFLGS